MSEIPSIDYESTEIIQQEPWDYATFVDEYNKAAGTNFHHFVPDSSTQYLEKNYKKHSSDYPTIKKFAISELEYEQVYSDDVLDKYRD